MNFSGMGMRSMPQCSVCRRIRCAFGAIGSIFFCSDCFRLERLPGGTYTHWKAPPLHGAHPQRTLQGACTVAGRRSKTRRSCRNRIASVQRAIHDFNYIVLNDGQMHRVTNRRHSPLSPLCGRGNRECRPRYRHEGCSIISPIRRGSLAMRYPLSSISIIMLLILPNLVMAGPATEQPTAPQVHEEMWSFPPRLCRCSLI